MMKYSMLAVLLIVLCSFLAPANKMHDRIPAHNAADTLPAILPSAFMDDYGIRYTINDTLWVQHPSSRYHILRWNTAEQYLIARNDTANASAKGLYTRIDYMKFSGMPPYTWGFCLTAYEAASDSLAEFASKKVDRANPKKGCIGFPFSRMRLMDMR